MRIIVISAWHNEAFLAPFFLGHYAYADALHLIIGDDTTDESREICARYPNMKIENYTFPDKLINDRLKIEKINAIAQDYWDGTAPDDWIVAVDSDEFIFPANGEGARDFLARQRADVIRAYMWNIYRHESEADLDPMLPAVPQRRHGDAKNIWQKPLAIRAAAKIVWTVGNHHYIQRPDIKESGERFLGAHWRMADEEMAVRRHIKGRRDRLSLENKMRSWGIHTFKMTEESLREECRRHLKDPELF